MAAPVFTAPDGRRWRREGECNRCGACCRSGDPLNPENNKLDLVDALAAGANVVQGHVSCPLYAEDENGIGTCTDREHPYYLSGCVVWPTEPDHIVDYPTCSYEFVEVTDGG